MLVYAEQRDGRDRGGQGSPGPHWPAQRATLGQRQEQQYQRESKQPGANQVDPLGLVGASLRQQLHGGNQRDESDGHVDQEDRTPAKVEHVGLDQRAAEDLAERGGRSTRDAEHRHRAGPVLASEQTADGGEHLRSHRGGRGALDDPGGEQHTDGRRKSADQRHQGEADEAGEEHPLAAEAVAEAAADDEQGGVGDAVAADDELELARVRVQVGADRGQRHVDDEEGEHRQERAEEQGREGDRTEW